MYVFAVIINLTFENSVSDGEILVTGMVTGGNIFAIFTTVNESTQQYYALSAFMVVLQTNFGRWQQFPPCKGQQKEKSFYFSSLEERLLLPWQNLRRTHLKWPNNNSNNKTKVIIYSCWYTRWLSPKVIVLYKHNFFTLLLITILTMPDWWLKECALNFTLAWGTVEERSICKDLMHLILGTCWRGILPISSTTSELCECTYQSLTNVKWYSILIKLC